MARGSTFKLYRKYNDYKLDKVDYNKIVDKYVKHQNTHDYSLFSDKKKVNRKTVDLPVVMKLEPYRSTYIDPKTGYNTVKEPDPKTFEIRADKNSYFTRDDRCHCDKLLEWSFGSGFDCLVEHYNLANYSESKSCMIINKDTAKLIRDAADYLLSGNWSKGEPSNEFIRILSDGYRCNGYYKYLNRNRTTALNKISFEQNGYKVNIECPKPSVNDEEYYECDDNEVVYWLERLRSILDTYLSSDDSEDYIETSSLLLTYEWWG